MCENVSCDWNVLLMKWLSNYRPLERRWWMHCRRFAVWRD